MEKIIIGGGHIIYMKFCIKKQ